jgi:predicted GIY-YIG superfamily endonuclease
MYYVYVLRNAESRELYYGYTNNLERRIAEHEAKRLWQLVYYEAYRAEQDARRREQHLKRYGQARSHLKKRLQQSLDGAN